jgi:hypothetical protein
VLLQVLQRLGGKVTQSRICPVWQIPGLVWTSKGMRHACIHHEKIHRAIAIVLAVRVNSAISQKGCRLCLDGMLPRQHTHLSEEKGVGSGCPECGTR